MEHVSPTYRKLSELAYADHTRPLATKTINGYKMSIHATDDKEDLDPENIHFYISTPAKPEYTETFHSDLFDIAKTRIRITPDQHHLRVEVIPVHDHVDSRSDRSHTTFPIAAPVQNVLKYVFDTVGTYKVRKQAYDGE